MEEKAPGGLWFRLLVYVVLVHAFAAFLFLLFEVAARR
ncbi:small hydrophobic protein [Streptomyces alkaliphilus]|uniref:Small hydrophobic protein n=1 Tax=Streptomyces alkaliphilus TaxID=1472722 RepID=A0A7W3THD5_9ACTN|nr:small hydrophobic protein [Streptomyces alkaliphilus]